MARRNPLEVYRAVVAETMGSRGYPDEETARLRLASALRKNPIPEWAQEILDSNGLRALYLLNHLLSLGAWPEAVREAVGQGLSLPTARLVAGLAKEAPDAVSEVLWPIHQRKGESAAEANRRVEREIVKVRSELRRSVYEMSGDWLQPRSPAARFTLPENDAWVYPSLPAGEREQEALHPWIASAIIERFSPPGGLVLDAMAGTGLIGETASELGRYAFLADLKPQHPHIHQQDVLTIEERFEKRKVDLAVLHPPTFETWKRSHRDQVEMEYLTFLSDAFAAVNDCVAYGGYVVAVTRPLRSGGRVIDTVGHLLTAFKEAVVLTDYTVAVARDGSEHWHILASRKELRT